MQLQTTAFLTAVQASSEDTWSQDSSPVTGPLSCYRQFVRRGGRTGLTFWQLGH